MITVTIKSDAQGEGKGILAQELKKLSLEGGFFTRLFCVKNFFAGKDVRIFDESVQGHATQLKLAEVTKRRLYEKRGADILVVVREVK